MLSLWGVSGALGSPWFTALGSCRRLMAESLTISRTCKFIHNHSDFKTIMIGGLGPVMCCTSFFHDINQTMVYAAKATKVDHDTNSHTCKTKDHHLRFTITTALRHAHIYSEHLLSTGAVDALLLDGVTHNLKCKKVSTTCTEVLTCIRRSAQF